MCIAQVAAMVKKGKDGPSKPLPGRKVVSVQAAVGDQV